jgi:hypothetical protein
MFARRRPWNPLGVFALAGLLALAAPGRAWAPPANGVPNMGVIRSCVVLGRGIPVAGFGFAPGTAVTISAPEGHYVGPLGLRRIRSVVVTANEYGGFSASLRTPPVPRRSPWFYETRVVFAHGPAQIDGSEGESFDTVLLGTKRVCKALGGRHPASLR